MKNSLLITITAGVSVFVLGQFFLKLVLDPIVSFKNTLGEVSALFLREQAKITNARASIKTQEEIKNLSSSILAHRQAIPFYKIIRVFFGLPSDDAIISSCRSLNWIGSSFIDGAPRIPPRQDIPIEIYKEMKNINKNLNIRVTYSEL